MYEYTSKIRSCDTDRKGVIILCASIAVTLAGGGIVLHRALQNAPEGVEGESGFSAFPMPVARLVRKSPVMGWPGATVPADTKSP